MFFLQKLKKRRIIKILHKKGMITLLGDVIKKLRKDRHMTQEQLGTLLGVKKAAVQKYESGTVKNLKQDTIQKLADAFGMSVGMFMALANEGQIRKEVQLIEEIQLHFGKEAVELLSDFTELSQEGKEKVLRYAKDMFLIQGVENDFIHFEPVEKQEVFVVKKQKV